MDYQSYFNDRLAFFRDEIAAACARAGREAAEVLLLPVTKTHPVEAVQAVAAQGLAAVGENRVQEAAKKRAELRGEMCLRWELIGHLQSNKAKAAVETFDRIQSADSTKLLRKLDKAAQEAGKFLPVLLQFNAGDDPAKYGFAVEEGSSVMEAVLACKHLRVEGLMTIAPFDDDRSVARRSFERLRELRDRLVEEFQIDLRELSMGMSGDFREAIMAGSTMIRVGTALFGSRDSG